MIFLEIVPLKYKKIIVKKIKKNYIITDKKPFKSYYI
jgi:hypothetical protein